MNDPQVQPMTKTDLAMQAQAPLARVEPSLELMIQGAIESGRPASELREFMEFAERAMRIRAERAYNAACAKFQGECPIIPKNVKVDYVTKSGVRIKYDYADLAQFKTTAGPYLAKHGLSFDWGKTVFTHTHVTVSCFRRHADGHCGEPVSVEMPIETNNPGMDPQKKVKGALTNAQSKSIEMAFGIIMGNWPVDMAPEPKESITAEQANSLTKVIHHTAEVCKRSPDEMLASFLGVAKIEKLTSLPAADFQRSVTWLEKIKAKGPVNP